MISLYDYAIVSHKLIVSLFVLARNADIFNVKCKPNMYASLQKIEFTKIFDLYKDIDYFFKFTRLRCGQNYSRIWGIERH